MYNSVYLIGRLTKDPETHLTESGKKVLTIALAVQRSYKNSDGIYEADFIRCVLWEGIATRVAEFCHKGDLIALRGMIRNNSYKNESEETKYTTEILVEKVSFLSTKNTKDDIIEEKTKKPKKTDDKI